MGELNAKSPFCIIGLQISGVEGEGAPPPLCPAGGTPLFLLVNQSMPHYNKKEVKSKEINPQGYYEVYFYDKDRKKKIMYIDDKFPVDKTYTVSDRHLYSECNSKEIWLQLLEKAFAKYEGGYLNGVKHGKGKFGTLILH